MAIANWLSLLLTPSLALGVLTINYALVTPACERQGDLSWVHGVFAVSMLLCLLCTLLAWRNWRQEAAARAGPGSWGRRRFAMLVGAMVGSFSSLVIVAQWLPAWILSPCQA